MSFSIALVTILALNLYVVLSFNVGRARGKYGVKAPATSGHEAFDRAYRVQMNTLEQLVLFLPVLWLFSSIAPLAHANTVGTALGGLWLVGRILYAIGYYRAADKRMVGFVIGLVASSLLLLGALLGIVMALFQTA